MEISSPRDALALGIRVIYQELNLVEQLSVAENIFLGAMPTRAGGFVDWTRAVCRRIAPAVRSRAWNIDPRHACPRLGPRAPADGRDCQGAGFTRLRQGSAGQATTILVMDEPTSALTSREVEQLFALIERLVSRGVAIVYITHRLDEVFRIGRRITVLRDGRHVTTRSIEEMTVAELVRLMANRDLSEHFPKVRAPIGPELLRVEHLTRRGVLSDISFSLRRRRSRWDRRACSAPAARSLRARVRRRRPRGRRPRLRRRTGGAISTVPRTRFAAASDCFPKTGRPTGSSGA